MNTCPVYRRSGGYSYSHFIPGPIGINLGMASNPEAHKGDLSACTLCHSCSMVCPAKVDLASQIYSFRQKYHSSASKRMVSDGMTVVMDKPWRLEASLKLAPFGVKAMKFMGITWGKGRVLPDIKPQNKIKDEC